MSALDTPRRRSAPDGAANGRTLRATLALLASTLLLTLSVSGSSAGSVGPQPSGSPALTLPSNARAFASPGGRYKVWLTPGPDPSLWMATADEPPQLLDAGEGEHFGAPVFSDDGLRMAYIAVPLGSGTAYLGVWHEVNLASRGLSRPGSVPSWVASPLSASEADPGVSTQSGTAMTPPRTIRVAHHPSNSCRAASAWSVVELSLEEYVARVLPAEVYASWPSAALQVQAVAVRTYAWWKIRNNPAGMTYDITDWAIDQVMCDARYPTTDAATAATAGFYLEYAGAPIFSQYSAENGHPTLDGGKPYLRPVIDLVSLGRTRNGHGRGLSQWGAYRWAAWHGWSVTQILSHYYTGARVIDPNNGDPLLSLLDPGTNSWLRGATAVVSAHASGDLATSARFRAPGSLLDASLIDQRWMVGWPTALAPRTPFTISVESGGKMQVVTLAGVDLEPPTGTITLPLISSVRSISVEVSSAFDTGGSELARVAIGRDCRADAANFVRQSGAGVFAPDPDASQGSALSLPAGQSGAWSAELGCILEADRLYQAYVRARIDASDSILPVARAEIADATSGALLGFMELRSGDAAHPGEYWEGVVDFWLAPTATGRLRVSLQSTGGSGVKLDRVRVLPAARPFVARLPYELKEELGPQVVVLKLIDNAGNPSADLVGSVELAGDATPPDDWGLIGPSDWVTDTLHPIITARAADPESGLALTSAAARSSTDGGSTWSAWSSADAESIGGGAGRLRMTWSAGEAGETGRVQFRISNMDGATALSPVWTVRVDVTAPTASLTAPPVSSPGAPIPVTWVGSDASGVASFDLRANFDQGPWGAWLLGVTGNGAELIPPSASFLRLQVRAKDVAGNLGAWSEERVVRVGLRHQYLGQALSSLNP